MSLPDPSRRSFLQRTAALSILPWLSSGAAAHPERPVGPAQRSDGLPFCVFSKHLQFLDYRGMAETAAAVGFEGVDLTVRPEGHVEPEQVEEDLPRAVEAVEAAGLTVRMMTTRITDPDDPHTEPVLRTASELGIRYYRMGYLSYDEDVSPVESLKSYRPMLRDLEAMNRAYGLHGAYQNHSGTRVGGPVWDLWILLEGMDPGHVGCQYDIRHAVVEGGTSWPLGFELLKPFIRITAMKDFVWARDREGRWRVRDVPIGEGMVDFPAYLDLLGEAGVDGPVSVHYEYPMPEETGEGLAEPELRRRTIDVMRRDLERLRGFVGETG